MPEPDANLTREFSTWAADRDFPTAIPAVDNDPEHLRIDFLAYCLGPDVRDRARARDDFKAHPDEEDCVDALTRAGQELSESRNALLDGGFTATEVSAAEAAALSGGW